MTVATEEFPPTPEQAEALRLFATRKSLAIEAGAGTGKTSTLKLLAKSTHRRGQYIAFNKAIVTEAKETMPKTVRCNTAHSLAWKNTIPGTRFAERLQNSRRMKSGEIADRIGIDHSIKVTVQDGDQKTLSRTYLAGLVLRGVAKFCQSADQQPDWFHVPYIDGIDIPPGNYTNNRAVAREIVAYMRAAWNDITNEYGSLPFQHDHYLKMWQLSKPRIGADFILFDEAQDANPVLVDIVKQQRHAQLVWVGDSQQQIYSFTGAVNALEAVGAEQEAYLSQSFRFGPDIAALANQILGSLDAKLRLTGFDQIESKVAPVSEPHVILCRTNAAAVRNVLAALRTGKRPHLVGGGGEVMSFAEGAKKLIDDGFTDHPELACFSDWDEVLRYVDQDEQGGDLKLLVSLIEEFTVDTILNALHGMPDERDADVVVSTAHKSKGRQWETVRLADDFPEQPKHDEELRLLYVAVTRAQLTVDISDCAYLANPSMTAAPDELSYEATPRDLAAVGCTCGTTTNDHSQFCPDGVDHHAADHDFASCPSCIREAREDEHKAEEVTTDAERTPLVSAGSPAPSATLGTTESLGSTIDTGDGYGKPENAKPATVHPRDLLFRQYEWREVSGVDAIDSDGSITIHFDFEGRTEWTKVPAGRSIRIRRKADTRGTLVTAGFPAHIQEGR